MERKLKDFWQWCELSDGYSTSQELLDSCELDDEGNVIDAGKVTLLGAEAHAASARLYLQCRFKRFDCKPRISVNIHLTIWTHRKPRNHPDVIDALKLLIRCIQISPNSGPLFTSQVTFFSVGMAGLLASREEDREIVRQWFVTVVEGSRGVSISSHW